MPVHEKAILVILDEGVPLSRVFGGSPAAPAPFLVARWANLPVADLRSGRIGAVLYPVGRRGRARPDRLRRLRRVASGIPCLAFRARRPRGIRAGGPPRRACGTPDSALHLPLSPDFVQAILRRERRVADLRRRARHAALQARDREAKLRALAAIVRCTGNELDPQRIVGMAMTQVSLFLKLRAWLFYLLDPEQGFLIIEQTGGQGMAVLKGARIGLGEGIAGRAAQKRQPVVLGDDPYGEALAVRPGLPSDLQARSSLAVPLLSRGRVIGVIEAIDTRAPGRFRSEHGRLLALLLEPAAVAVDNALLLRKSEELSITDDLTKLHNSRFLNTTLRREVERSRRYGTPVSLIFLDLDGFKDVNDQHGHLCGSRTLVEVGEVIKGTVREIDVVSRYGGDEFTVILPQTGPEGAQIIAERIRQRIAETNFLSSYGLKVRITASVGIASFPDHARTKDDLIARADQAMYVVKGRGKNGVALAEPDGPRQVAAGSLS